MLVLSRKVNERIVLQGTGIEFVVCHIRKDRVRIGIEAPENVVVLRKELEGDRAEIECSVEGTTRRLG